MDIIGLNGFARSGKDTAGKHLVDRQGYTRFACGDPLKQALYILNPILDSTSHLGLLQRLRAAFRPRPIQRLAPLLDELGGDWEQAKNHPVYGNQLRVMMQVFGTEVCRTIFGPDIWVRTLERNVRESGAGRIVVTDIRFDEEARWVVESGGTVLKITRPRVKAVNAHTSEKGIHPNFVTATIANDGTIEDLGRAIDAFTAPTSAAAPAATPVTLLAA